MTHGLVLGSIVTLQLTVCCQHKPSSAAQVNSTTQAPIELITKAMVQPLQPLQSTSHKPRLLTQHTTYLVAMSTILLGFAAGTAASNDLQQQFGLSKEQAEGVLNMSLRRLTSLEATRLQEEAEQLRVR